ncbi:hypothetical protein [Robertkochia sediminum]|uniref:hypothetical protein n=1 Tax=Robertkochia sediminum TaxID=2785326 RepID=UPI0019316923|nr:hypothetical protein [Robertkochia sediminum]MBL7473681.1 hypothetical protein [Robertkochia sediminum]
MKKFLQWKWYLLLSLLYMLATVFEWEPVRDLLRLGLLPLVFGFYASRHSKLSGWVWAILGGYYIADVLQPWTTPVIAPIILIGYSIGHLIISYICYRCMEDFNVKRILFSAIPFIALWLIYFNYSMKDIFGAQMGESYPYIMAYAILLSVYFIITLIKFFNDEQKVFLYLVIVALTFVGRYIVMGMYYYVTPALIFEISFSFATAAGYFFLMRFVDEFDFKRI